MGSGRWGAEDGERLVRRKIGTREMAGDGEGMCGAKDERVKSRFQGLWRSVESFGLERIGRAYKESRDL